MCNLFKMELNIVVGNVTTRQLRYKAYDDMWNLFTMELNNIVHTVFIRKLRNKAFNIISNLLTKEVNICDSHVRNILSTPV